MKPFKSLKYKAKLIGETNAQPAPNADNGFLKNAAIAEPLKYPRNFQTSLEMPLINCKIELKLKWTKHCVLVAAGGVDNDNANSDIIFTVKDTKLYVPLVTFSAKDI